MRNDLFEALGQITCRIAHVATVATEKRTWQNVKRADIQDIVIVKADFRPTGISCQDPSSVCGSVRRKDPATIDEAILEINVQ